MRKDRPDGSTRSASGELVWVPPETSITVDGCEIGDGMVYVSMGRPNFLDDNYEPSAIFAHLPIEWTALARPAQADWGMRSGLGQYWPRYDSMSRWDRARYLRWLAGGRRDPDAPIGCAFLFFYGLERRLLVDAGDGGVAPAEVSALYRELVGLAKAYGKHPYFRRYASILARRVVARFSPRGFSAPPRQDPRNSRLTEMRVGVGRLAADGRRLDEQWALAWLREDDRIRLGVVPERLPEEFRALFTLRFKEQYPKGLALDSYRVSSLRLRGAIANESISRRLSGAAVEGPGGVALPDLGDMIALPATLEHLALAVCEELKPYARRVKSGSEDGPNAAALSLLPQPLVASALSAAQAAWVEEKRELIERRGAVIVEGKDLAEVWGVPGGKRTAAQRRQLQAALVACGFLVAPAESCGLRTGNDGIVALGAAGDASAEAHSESLAVLALLAELLRAVGGTAERFDALADALTEQGADSRVMRAHARWFASGGQGWPAVRKAGKDDNAKRRRIADRALCLAARFGANTPAGVKALQKAYGLLRLDAENLLDELHERTLAPASSAGVATREVGPIGQGSARPGSVTNEDVLERKRAAAQAVSLLLEEIFEPGDLSEVRGDEPRESDAQEAAPEPQTLAFPGLDAAHAEFAKALAARKSWTMEEVRALAASYGLMAAGALDRVNEAAFECCDAPFAEEEGGALLVDTDIYEEAISS